VSPRAVLAIVAGRLAGAASRLFGRGGGTAVTGLVANAIDPNLATRLARQLGHGCVIVTGTNGKTTTARMVATIAGEAGLRPIANPSGSNLMRGVTTALIEHATSLRQAQAAASRLGVFEVDEATVPEAVRALAPRAIVFTNLFRDQLDRYGEVDTVAALWRGLVEGLPAGTTLILCVDDPAVASLAEVAPGTVLAFGIQDIRVADERIDHASDYRFCLACGAELTYSAAFYGHVGHWRCASCGRARPAPDVRATCVEAQSNAATRLAIETRGHKLQVDLPLAGVYNAENALAATAAALAFDVPFDAIERALTTFRPAFGRQERFKVDRRDILVLLGKNPTGMNQVLRTITATAAADGKLSLLLFLNDGIADGRDISWIWDTDYELLTGHTEQAIVSGSRAEELALRLDYAGLSKEPRVVREAAAALSEAIASTPPGGTLYVIPTYTAMLEVRELLAKQGQREHFWEEG
jgi:UDP-N-acetylmuramyl tripeptide synthase